jgi:hypothetical protein
VTKFWLRALVVLLLVVVACAAVLVAVAWTVFPLDRVSIDFGGATYSFADLHGWDVVLVFLGAVAAIVLALTAAFVALILAMAVGAIGLAVGLLATIASIAVFVGPFVFVGWLLWRLLRRHRPSAAVAAP